MIADSYSLLKKTEKYSEAKEKSKKIISISDFEKTKKAEAYFYIAGCASKIGDLTWEKESLTTGLMVSNDLEDKRFHQAFQKLLDDLDSKNNVIFMV